jgi:transitional endoplasmic reticulum ATPase
MVGAPETELKLKVTEALPKDTGRALARLDPADMARLSVQIGDIVEVSGKRKTVCKAMPAYKDQRGQARIQIDGLVRENAGAALDQPVTVRKANPRPAEKVVLTALTITPRERDLENIGS